MMSTIVSVSTCEGDNDGDDDDYGGDEHHRVRVDLDHLSGDMCKSSESFGLQSNLFRYM